MKRVLLSVVLILIMISVSYLASCSGATKQQNMEVEDVDTFTYNKSLSVEVNDEIKLITIDDAIRVNENGDVVIAKGKELFVEFNGSQPIPDGTIVNLYGKKAKGVYAATSTFAGVRFFVVLEDNTVCQVMTASGVACASKPLPGLKDITHVDYSEYHYQIFDRSGNCTKIPERWDEPFMGTFGDYVLEVDNGFFVVYDNYFDRKNVWVGTYDIEEGMQINEQGNAYESGKVYHMNYTLVSQRNKDTQNEIKPYDVKGTLSFKAGGEDFNYFKVITPLSGFNFGVADNKEQIIDPTM